MSCCGEPTPRLICETPGRRAAIRRENFNGLDYLEVSDSQLELTVYFLGRAPQGLGPENFRICGGRRVRGIRVVDVRVCPQVDPELDNCLVVTVDRPGDFSTYTLELVAPPDDACFDPRYRTLLFTFKAACPSEFDCKTEPSCPPEVREHPVVDYLAKDYASFRRLLLDRLALTLPAWRERHVPDLGITLVEVLAYVADYLSYYQDAVATEAYLGTARQRISVRRHARLVDYFLHEGCNARAWVAVETSSEVTIPAAELSFLTAFAQAPDAEDRILTWDALAPFPPRLFEVFEPLTAEPELHFRTAHNRIRFYTWGDSECCLPSGATSATLIDGNPPPPEEPGCEDEKPELAAGDPPDPARDVTGRHRRPEPPTDPEPGPGGTRALDLAPGDLLILAEGLGPRTGSPFDADPVRRHAVRLTRVEPVVDPLNGQPLLEVAWAAEDALPFPFCLSVLGPPPACALLEDVSVALGNVVLADHGRTRPSPQDLGCVPVAREEIRCKREGRPTDPVRHPGRFEHAEIDGPLTFAVAPDLAGPAAGMLDQDPRQALPSLSLWSAVDPECLPQGTPADAGPRVDWIVRRDLLASGPEDAHVVVETDDRRQTHLRFGDGKHGRRPDAGARFATTYRVGNGPAGNVGADKLTLAVTISPINGASLKPRNPLPARGGTASEPVAEAKLFAPHAFGRVLERAVTPADYAEIAARHPGVQRAAAELRWNGSWYEVRVAVDPAGRGEPDVGFLAAVKRSLYPFRRIGHDLAVLPAGYVPLDIEMAICVEPPFLRADVKAALVRRFGTGCLPDGKSAFFHPDSLTFGQGVALSPLVAAAQSVPGVRSASVTRLERLFEGPNGELAAGVLAIGPLEVARLDADPDFPENGRIRFTMRGGR